MWYANGDIYYVFGAHVLLWEWSAVSSVMAITIISAADFRQFIATAKQGASLLCLKLQATQGGLLIQINDTSWNENCSAELAKGKMFHNITWNVKLQTGVMVPTCAIFSMQEVSDAVQWFFSLRVQSKLRFLISLCGLLPEVFWHCCRWVRHFTDTREEILQPSGFIEWLFTFHLSFSHLFHQSCYLLF